MPYDEWKTDRRTVWVPWVLAIVVLGMMMEIMIVK